MAINRLRGDQPAPLWPQRQRRMAGRRLSCLARNACQRRGRKSTDRRCGKVIEAQPTLGQISPSEAAMAPRGQTERRVGDYWGLLTRGRDDTAWNRVRVRISGGKTAAEKERLLPHLRPRDRVLRSGEAIGHREDALVRWSSAPARRRARYFGPSRSYSPCKQPNATQVEHWACAR